MTNESIELRGTYLYANPDALDRALAAARSRLDAELDGDREVDWMRCFMRQGSRLWVHGQLPDQAITLAVGVVTVLANEAVEGLVVARRGEQALDYFPCGA
jgi:hypothetical protein